MKKIKILPVYPKFPLTYWSFEVALDYINRKATMVPNGLPTAMAFFPQEHFNIHKIIDENVEPLTDEQIKEADYLAISTMNLQENSRNKIIKRAHKLGKKVIEGGPYVTSCPERTNADHVITGEAETTLPLFLEDILNGKPLKKVYSPENLEKPDLLIAPIPRWDLLDMENYFSAAIQYSRGCPFDCEFCDITQLYGRNPRTKSPEQILSELDAVYQTGHRGSTMFVDDNFMGNKKNLKELLPELIKWQEQKKYPFSFFTQASMNLGWPENKELLEDIVKAGFDMVFLGIESTDPNVLEIMNKKQNTKYSPLESVRNIQKAGLEVTGGFIIGADGEKPNSFEETRKFIQDAGIVFAMAGMLNVLPKTKQEKRLREEGRLKSASTGNNTHQLGFNFKTQLPENQLIESYLEGIEKLYSPKDYYERCLTLQKHQGRHRQQKRTNLEGIAAFGKLLKRRLFTRGGFELTKYLTTTLITRPTAFPEAVSRAIKQHHFETITRETLKANDYTPHINSLYERFSDKVEKVLANQRKSMHEKREQITTYASKIIKKAEKRYRSLHEDFREKAQTTLQSLRDKINLDLERYNEASSLA